ncbi:MAG: oligoendopeptidase F, partial [Clostridia bacterium]
MNKLPQRHEIDDRYKWRLEDIYKDDEAFETDFSKAGGMCVEMLKMKEKATEAGALKSCLLLYEELNCLTDNLFSYARMKMDEDNSDSGSQVRLGKARELSVRAEAAASFIEP